VEEIITKRNLCGIIKRHSKFLAMPYEAVSKGCRLQKDIMKYCNIVMMMRLFS
jgi:hypothetical protein